MPRYSAFIALNDGPGHYQELEQLFDAPHPRAAAQQVIDSAAVHPDDEFPLILVVEERTVGVFSRDDDRRAVTLNEDLPRLLDRGPAGTDVRLPGDPDGR